VIRTKPKPPIEQNEDEDIRELIWGHQVQRPAEAQDPEVQARDLIDQKTPNLFNRGEDERPFPNPFPGLTPHPRPLASDGGETTESNKSKGDRPYRPQLTTLPSLRSGETIAHKPERENGQHADPLIQTAATQAPMSQCTLEPVHGPLGVNEVDPAVLGSELLPDIISATGRVDISNGRVKLPALASSSFNAGRVDYSRYYQVSTLLVLILSPTDPEIQAS